MSQRSSESLAPPFHLEVPGPYQCLIRKQVLQPTYNYRSTWERTFCMIVNISNAWGHLHHFASATTSLVRVTTKDMPIYSAVYTYLPELLKWFSPNLVLNNIFKLDSHSQRNLRNFGGQLETKQNQPHYKLIPQDTP